MSVLKYAAHATAAGVPLLAALALGASWGCAAAAAAACYCVVVYAFKYWVMRRPQPPARLLSLPPDLPDTSALPSHAKFCVVGAGFAGLAVSAEFKRRGIPFETLEQDTQIGGNWHQAVYPGVHIISSKLTTEYGDFPMPPHYPAFPSARQVLAYLNDYAAHFALLPHIRFGKKVVRVDPVEGGRRWHVTTEDGACTEYKGVVVCNGHDWCPRIPQYPGADACKIQRIHSRQYKSPEQLIGKRVLVVGGGNSGCDIAVAAAEHAVSSSISLRRGYWFLPRTMLGRPTVEIFQHWLPHFVQDKIIRLGLWTVFGSYSSHGLQEPDYNFFDHPVSVSCSMLQNIKLGRITPHPAVQRLGPSSVHFADGTSRDDIDLIIYATGYHVALPMMEHLVEFKDGVPQMLNGVTHPTLRHCFMFGLGQARYGAGPLFTAGASVLADTVLMQERLRYPVGRLLRQMGARAKRPARATSEVIIDPHVAFGQAMVGHWLVAFLPYFERFFYRPEKPDEAAQ